MKFKMNYYDVLETEEDFRALVNDLHNEDGGWNFLESCRMWGTNDKGETFMVEHQCTTKTAIEIIESENPTEEPDWLTVYLVKDEEDYDCSKQVYTETVDNNISLEELKKRMVELIKEV